MPVIRTTGEVLAMDEHSSGISGLAREHLARLTGRGRQLVTVDDAVDRLGLDREAAAKRLARWAEQGWLRRVRRGLYLAVPVDAERPDLWTADPLVLATAVWSPCYATGWTAGNHWGLTEQVFRAVVVKTSNRVRSTKETLLEHEYLLGHVGPDRLTWGLRNVWVAGTRVQLADEARVIIETLDDPAIGGGVRHAADMLASFMGEHDPALLIEYGDQFGNAAVFKRLGYLCETLGLADPAYLTQVEERLSPGIADLDPDAAAVGESSTRWRLRGNVRLEGRNAS
jgi:predicted transcriptional regulator of viral defense system